MLEQIYSFPFWNNEYWGNAVGDYAVAFGAFLVFLVGLKIIQLVVLKQLELLSKKTATDIDDTFIEIIRSIKPPFYSFLAFYLAILMLSLSSIMQTVFNTLLLIWIAYQIVIAVQILIDYIVAKKFTDSEDDASNGIVSFISGLLKATLWAFAVLAVLSNLGVNVNSLIAGLGIGGLAIAFALQNILADLFSSFAIHLDKPFKTGDYIVVGEHSGVVQKIGIKTTRIKALQGEEIVISNTELTTARVQNFKKLTERRVSFSIGVTYETASEKIKTIPLTIKRVLEEESDVRFDRSHFSSFGDSALNFDTVYYVLSADYADYMDIQQRVNLKLLETFAEQGIEFAYPTQTLFVKK